MLQKFYGDDLVISMQHINIECR